MRNYVSPHQSIAERDYHDKIIEFYSIKNDNHFRNNAFKKYDKLINYIDINSNISYDFSMNLSNYSDELLSKFLHYQNLGLSESNRLELENIIFKITVAAQKVISGGVSSLNAECLLEFLAQTSVHDSSELNIAYDISTTRQKIDAMNLKDRKNFLDAYYSKRMKWADLCSNISVPADMLKWADENFPDRIDLGLVFSDLKHLDQIAYQKIINWRRKNIEISGLQIPLDLGFPFKRELHTRLIASNAVPTSTEVCDAFRTHSLDARKKSRLYAMKKARDYRAQP